MEFYDRMVFDAFSASFVMQSLDEVARGLMGSSVFCVTRYGNTSKIPGEANFSRARGHDIKVRQDGEGDARACILEHNCISPGIRQVAFIRDTQTNFSNISSRQRHKPRLVRLSFCNPPPFRFMRRNWREVSRISILNDRRCPAA